MKREALRLGWFEISNWNFQKKIKLFVCIWTVDKTYKTDKK
jgi:hypothetical protein